MIAHQFLQLFERDINRVKEEILNYKKEENIWKVSGAVSNSSGTLCLHLIGNLHHFIGAVLGDTGFKRDRDKEFSERNVSREKLVEGLDKSLAITQKILSRLKDEDLMKEYPIEFLDSRKTTLHVLLFILSHLEYHLGQINYHRRLID
jgi:hypothetical protein